MTPSTSTRSGSCTHSTIDQRGSLHLPVLTEHNPRGTIRKSKSGKRRAVVLATIQLLIIAHIVLWVLSTKFSWFGGKTITPVEPSESMEFVKHGVINAGLIFFVFVLLSTLILGRWFCGWGCHVVMLQDLCSWIMKKCGIRPKAFRSRLLIYVPFILALYMFIWPAVYRWGVVPLSQQLSQQWEVIPNLAQLPAWTLSTHTTTTEFWKTFPGVAVAIPFLFVCGFACVYFLGAKGFCTYGCPYGGFFAPLDRFAVGSIRVTDACEQCGHCTAVCTSNVRVHEEVREYGMVVDPGCMKCLDCVSVCPNDALYFGFGKPTILAGKAKNKKPKKIYDMTMTEEIAFSLIFLLTFLGVRGVYGLVPMLMAAGVAGITTFLAWKLWRVLRDQNVTLYRYQLRLKGATSRAGWIFTAAVALYLFAILHSGIVNGAFAVAEWYDKRVAVPSQVVFSGRPFTVRDDVIEDADRALRFYSFSSSVNDGGVGAFRAWQSRIDIRKAWLLTVKNDFESAERILRENEAWQGKTEAISQALALVLRGAGKNQDAMNLYESCLLEHPEYSRMRTDFANWIIHLAAMQLIQSNPDSAEDILMHGLSIAPDHPELNRKLGELLTELGRVDEAQQYIKRAGEATPHAELETTTLPTHEREGTMNY